jgi:hypothetical protein
MGHWIVSLLSPLAISREGAVIPNVRRRLKPAWPTLRGLSLKRDHLHRRIAHHAQKLADRRPTPE